MSNTPLKTNMPRDHPGTEYYYILPQEDGTVDIYLIPKGRVYHTDMGITEYDIHMVCVKGIVPWPGLEADIRARYYAWCESGEVISPC